MQLCLNKKKLSTAFILNNRLNFTTRNLQDLAFFWKQSTVSFFQYIFTSIACESIMLANYHLSKFCMWWILKQLKKQNFFWSAGNGETTKSNVKKYVKSLQ